MNGDTVALQLLALLYFVVTDARTGTAHLVTDEAVAAGRRTGRYAATCGGEVLAASLAEPECGYCRVCADWRAAR